MKRLIAFNKYIKREWSKRDLVISDIDFTIYNRAHNEIMMLEAKCFRKMDWDDIYLKQRGQFLMYARLDSLMSAGSAFKRITYAGAHVVSFSHESVEDSYAMWLNGIPINERELHAFIHNPKGDQRKIYETASLAKSTGYKTFERGFSKMGIIG